MTTTTHDEGFHEIQLNGKQLVFLFMAGTVVAVVIFLLGVFVGRGVTAQTGPVAPLVAEQPDEAAPDAPLTSTSSGAEAPASASQDVTYTQRLGDEGPVKEPAFAQPKAAAPAPSLRAPRPPAAATAAAQSAVSSAPGEPPGDGFAIQVAALAKRDEAEGIVRRLSGKGYSAYLMAPGAGAASMYRVRVGKFKDRREAESVSSRLQKEEQFKPWIVR